MLKSNAAARFENDVKIYGIQTPLQWCYILFEFENDVKIYGIQTTKYPAKPTAGLRMM